MIVEHSGTAIDLSELLSINYVDVDENDNRVVFKFKPVTQYVRNPDTKQLELHTIYPTTHASFVFSASMFSAFDWWVNAWQEYKEACEMEED